MNITLNWPPVLKYVLPIVFVKFQIESKSLKLLNYWKISRKPGNTKNVLFPCQFINGNHLHRLFSVSQSKCKQSCSGKKKRNLKQWKVVIFIVLLINLCKFNFGLLVTEAYLEPCQTYKVELFAKIVNDENPLTIFPKAPSKQIYRVALNTHTRDALICHQFWDFHWNKILSTYSICHNFDIIDIDQI